jgi:DNA helicase-4
LFKLGPFPLDDDQKTAVITDDKYNLVVAGAGSGKTEVLTTRIAYLIKRKPDTILPDRILALAFQRDAADQIRSRLNERYGLNIKIKTFHSLGLEILKKAGTRFNLYGGDNYETDSKKLVEKLFTESLKDKEFQKEVIRFLEQIGAPDDIKEENDFNTKEEFYRYQRDLRYTTLDGTEVKSIGEREIMNFFLTHKLNDEIVEICYEDYANWMIYVDHEGKRETPQPDFFLPDYNIYIEHWSVDKSGNVPPWYEGDYIETMNIKKQKFAEQGQFILVETTFGEFVNNPDFQKLLEKKVISALKQKFPGKEFIFTPIEYHELVEKVWADCQASARSLPHNIFNFIVIAKTYKLKPDDISNKLIKEK